MKEYLSVTATNHPLIAFVLYQMAAAVMLIGAVAAFTCICSVPVYLITRLF